MNVSSDLKWIGRKGNTCRKQYPGVLAECIFLAKGSLDERELPSGCKADVGSSYTIPFSLCRRSMLGLGRHFGGCWRPVFDYPEHGVQPLEACLKWCMRRAVTAVTCAHGPKWWWSCNQPCTLWNTPTLLFLSSPPSPPDPCAVVPSLI